MLNALFKCVSWAFVGCSSVLFEMLGMVNSLIVITYKWCLLFVYFSIMLMQKIVLTVEEGQYIGNKHSKKAASLVIAVVLCDAQHNFTLLISYA